MALVSKTFSQIITFTRASTATYFDATGTLQSAAIDAPRLDYNPATLAAQGLLIEEARTNLLTYSAQFDNVNWTKTDATVTANAVTSPDGTVNADKLVEGTLSIGHFVQQLVSITTATAYTGSIYVKAGERSTVDILVYRGATFGGLSVNLSTGAKAAPQTAAVSDLSATSTVKAVSNGYFIVSVPFTSDGVSGGLRVTLSNGSTTAYTGDGTSGLYVWGAQLEAGAFPTSYIPTTTTALTRSADVASVNTLSPWYNATEGTLFVEAQVDTNRSYSGTFRHTVQISPTVNSDSGLAVLINTTNNFENSVRDNAVTVAQLTTGTNTGVVFKSAGAYKVNDFAFSVNGGAPVTDTSGAVPTTPAVTQMKIGGVRDGNALGQLNGYLRRITYYPRRLSNAELQTITA